MRANRRLESLGGPISLLAACDQRDSKAHDRFGFSFFFSVSESVKQPFSLFVRAHTAIKRKGGRLLRRKDKPANNPLIAGARLSFHPLPPTILSLMEATK